MIVETMIYTKWVGRIYLYKSSFLEIGANESRKLDLQEMGRAKSLP